MRTVRALGAILVISYALAGAARAGEPVTVFAAASLTNAMQEVGRAYREKTGREIRLSFASSSTLARQIEAGAGADIFASANEKWMDYLAGKGLIEKDKRVSPIGNRLVLIAPGDNSMDRIDLGGPVDLAALLGADGRLAVGDPDHVPAGIYAKQALAGAGLWEIAEPRLARADNVRAALALVERGETPLGIVYATDAAISDGVRIVGTFPEALHTPISYPFAIVKDRGGEEADALFAFMTGPQGQAIFERFGFSRR